MSNPIAIEKSRDGKRRAVERLYAYLTLHEATATADGDLAERFHLPKQDVRNLRYDLVEIGSLRTVRQAAGKQGSKVVWTLVEPENVTKARLEAKWRRDDARTAELLRQPNASKASHRRDRGGNGPDLGGATPDHPVVPDALVASSGPEASKPLAQPLTGARYDEPRAMIEAARQYHDVNKQLDAKVKELEALGMTVDRTALAKAIKAPHDHVLLVVSKVLPYVEGLERANERLTQQNTDLREKAARVTEAERDNGRLSDQNRRLVSEIQALRATAHNNGRSAEPAPKGDAPSATPVGSRRD